MKQPLPSPITKDNFAETWEIVDSERRIAKKKYVTTKVASFFSNMVFAILTLLVGNCLIHDHMTGSYCDFLEIIPYLLPTWKKISAIVLKPDLSILLQIAIPILLIYAICFIVCGFFVLVVTAVYHPSKLPLPASTDKENASQMLTMARDARRYANKSGDRGSTVWALVFMMFLMVLIAMYWVTDTQNLDRMTGILIAPVMQILKPYLTSSLAYASAEGSLMIPSIMLFILGLYVAYMLLDLLHSMSVQFMYKYTVPYSFVAEVEYYYIFSDENTEGLTDEEAKVRRKETAEAKRIKALDLERIGAYGKAKELLAAAAHGGDPDAMEHYARHWLIANAKDPGKYWLRKCVDTGSASITAQDNLKRLKWHRKVQVHYLKET